MGTSYDGLTPELSAWIEQQHVFFVATAPLAGDGLINCSPKGMDTFRILGTHEVAYLDLTLGSPHYDSLSQLFPEYPGRRAIVHARLKRISHSCGYGVPRYRYTGERDTLVRLAESRGQDRLVEYRRKKNARSLDNLPGLTGV